MNSGALLKFRKELKKFSWYLIWFSLFLGEWCQTINIRKTRPLLKSGLLNLSLLQEMPHVTYLSNIHKGKYHYFTPCLFHSAIFYLTCSVVDADSFSPCVGPILHPERGVLIYGRMYSHIPGSLWINVLCLFFLLNRKNKNFLMISFSFDIISINRVCDRISIEGSLVVDFALWSRIRAALETS